MALNFPNSPSEGDQYQAEGVTFVYTQGRWAISGMGQSGITIGDAFPINPAPGALHYMTTAVAGLYVFYQDVDSGQWIQSNGAFVAPPPANDFSTGVANGGSQVATMRYRIDRVQNTLEYWGFTDGSAGAPTIEFNPFQFLDTNYATVGSINMDSNTTRGHTIGFYSYATASVKIKNFRLNNSNDNQEMRFYIIGTWDGLEPT